jgi:hypothetical protein
MLKIPESQLQKVMFYLYEWIEENEVSRASLLIEDDRLRFVAGTKDNVYDDAFEDGLSKLDWNIAQDEGISKIEMSVQSTPKDIFDGLVESFNPIAIIEFDDIEGK